MTENICLYYRVLCICNHFGVQVIVSSAFNHTGTLQRRHYH